MTRLIIPLAILVAAALFGGAWFWATHPPAYAVSVAEIIDHHFVVAAYTVTWTLQLGYLTWLAFKWRDQKRSEQRLGGTSR
jgi:hypothetical protein